jgi:hypothetical protein
MAILKCNIRGIHSSQNNQADNYQDEGFRWVKVEGCEYRLEEKQIFDWLSHFVEVKSKILEDTHEDSDDSSDDLPPVGNGIYSAQMKLKVRYASTGSYTWEKGPAVLQGDRQKVHKLLWNSSEKELHRRKSSLDKVCGTVHQQLPQDPKGVLWQMGNHNRWNKTQKKCRQGDHDSTTNSEHVGWRQQNQQCRQPKRMTVK